MQDRIALLIEKDRILERVKSLFINTDRKDWAEVVDDFTDQVRFDMSSMGGGPPAFVPAVEIAAGWEEGLQDITAVHHQIGNELVTVDGDSAHVFCYGIALHHSPRARKGTTKRFVGTYDLDLLKEKQEWKISGFAYNLKFVDGNVDLA
ncbi:MAG: nuclear transport factor 2 family protein [Methanomicrobiales archaeon]|nr:nuclear transport factor 2 family protein [Methanomicrobiales archaeon]